MKNDKLRFACLCGCVLGAFVAFNARRTLQVNYDSYPRSLNIHFDDGTPLLSDERVDELRQERDAIRWWQLAYLCCAWGCVMAAWYFWKATREQARQEKPPLESADAPQEEQISYWGWVVVGVVAAGAFSTRDGYAVACVIGVLAAVIYTSFCIVQRYKQVRKTQDPPQEQSDTTD